MIDISKAKWDFSKEEEYAISWFNEHGFNGSIDKQYVSKTIFTISKDGITEKFELPQGIKFMNIKGYMQQYEINWDLTCRIHALNNKQMKND